MVALNGTSIAAGIQPAVQTYINNPAIIVSGLVAIFYSSRLLLYAARG